MEREIMDIDYKIDGRDILLRQSDFALDDTLDCGQAFRWEKIADNAYHGAFLNKQLTISCENGSDLFKSFLKSGRIILTFGQITAD